MWILIVCLLSQLSESDAKFIADLRDVLGLPPSQTVTSPPERAAEPSVDELAVRVAVLSELIENAKRKEPVIATPPAGRAEFRLPDWASDAMLVFLTLFGLWKRFIAKPQPIPIIDATAERG